MTDLNGFFIEGNRDVMGLIIHHVPDTTTDFEKATPSPTFLFLKEQLVDLRDALNNAIEQFESGELPKSN